MKLLAFAFLLFTLAGFGVATAVIIYHLSQYSVPGDKTRELLQLFVAGSAVFLVITLFAFLSVPWEQITISLPVL